MKLLTCLGALLFLSIVSAFAADNKELVLIEQTARNYMEAWYEGDAGKMKQSLHKKLAKRSLKEGFDGNSRLGFTTASEMVSYTRSGYGKQLWQKDLNIDVTVLDHHKNIASVLVVSPHYHEYLHLAKLDKSWVIVNALYQ